MADSQTDSPDAAAAPAAAPPTRKRRRSRLMAAAAALFAVIGIGYFAYWYVALRHYEQTDDAYVQADKRANIFYCGNNVSISFYINHLS